MLREVINLLKTTMTCAAYALVIGKNSADVWTALELHGWYSEMVSSARTTST